METIYKKVIIIGAGPAGLATSKVLKDYDIDHLILEKGKHIANSWRIFYKSLTLHTGKHLSHLPGMKFKKEVNLFPPKKQFIDYMEDYKNQFKLPIQVSSEVKKIERVINNKWKVFLDNEIFECDFLVLGVGLASFPFTPKINGIEQFKGEIIHSIKYKTPELYKDKSVLIVGAGNSAAEISYELSEEGIDTTIYIKSGANVAPLSVLGFPIQYVGYIMSVFPKTFQLALIKIGNFFIDLLSGGPLIPRPNYSPLDRPPIIGKKFLKSIKKGSIKYQKKIISYKEDGIILENNEFKKIDTIILATGFKVNFDIFEVKIEMDNKGFAKRKDRVEDYIFSNLFYVGQNYDSTGGLVNIRKDSQIIGKKIKNILE
ncbi:MAG: hypothetical protein CME68_07550 [Halobacteriovoraceae bacterium]|nr:hypothetical protein [Halobacteriovoraceae bacterium]